MHKNQVKGFTLVETIVVIVLLSIITFGVIYIMVEGSKIWLVNKNYIELRSNGRFALARLAAEFRQANSVSLISAANISFNSDIDNDGYPQQITYTLDGTDLNRDEEYIGPAVICDNVGPLVFSWNPPLLTAEITLSKQNDTVKLRSKIVTRCLP